MHLKQSPVSFMDLGLFLCLSYGAFYGATEAIFQTPVAQNTLAEAVSAIHKTTCARLNNDNSTAITLKPPHFAYFLLLLVQVKATHLRHIHAIAVTADFMALFMANFMATFMAKIGYESISERNQELTRRGDL